MKGKPLKRKKVLIATTTLALVATVVVTWGIANLRLGDTPESRTFGTKKVIQVDDKSFATEISESHDPVLVMFHAPWCQPCTRMMPLLNTIATHYESTLKVVVVDCEGKEFLRQKYSIHRYPIIAVFQNGVEVNRHTGEMVQHELDLWVRSVLPMLAFDSPNSTDTLPSTQ